MFMRDAKQAEVLLSQQDNFLAKEEAPVSTALDKLFNAYRSHFQDSTGLIEYHI